MESIYDFVIALCANMSYLRKRYRIKIAFFKILILCQIKRFLFCRFERYSSDRKFDTVAKKKDVCTSTISSTKGPYKLCLIILFSIQNFIVKIETMLSYIISSMYRWKNLNSTISLDPKVRIWHNCFEQHSFSALNLNLSNCSAVN